MTQVFFVRLNEVVQLCVIYVNIIRRCMAHQPTHRLREGVEVIEVYRDPHMSLPSVASIKIPQKFHIRIVKAI